MLIPNVRFFVVPFATACVLVALAMTQQASPPSDSAAVVVVPATQMQVCGTDSRNRTCTLPAG